MGNFGDRSGSTAIQAIFGPKGMDIGYLRRVRSDPIADPDDHFVFF
jgi:hypothetical protein